MKEKEKPKGYQMPHVSLGQVVLWFYGPDKRDRVTAIVTGVGNQAIDVIAFPRDTLRGTPKHGCRHYTDPGFSSQVEESENFKMGVWDFTDEHKLLKNIEARIARIESDLIGPVKGK